MLNIVKVFGNVINLFIFALRKHGFKNVCYYKYRWEFLPKRKIGGYAFWIVCNLGTLTKAGKIKHCESAVEAELKAIGNAIFIVKKKLHPSKVTKIIINTDCLNAIKVLTEPKNHFKYNNKFHKKIQKIVRRIRGCFKHYTVEFRHVRAHSNVDDKRTYVNNYLDKQAKQAAKVC